jgi:signal transduction histidine kinase
VQAADLAARLRSDPPRVADERASDVPRALAELTAATVPRELAVSGALSARLDAARSAVNGATTAAVVTGAVLAAMATLVVVVGLQIGRSVSRPLRRLAAAADQVAELASAELARVSDSDDLDAPAPQLAAVRVEAPDELGTLAASFNRVQAMAALLLERQVLVRRNSAAMLGNVGQRTRSLVARQLAIIDSLERDEQAPDRLDRLYRLDHITSRLRRNADSLLTLSSAAEPDLAGGPEPVADIVRAALSSIEDFHRVQLDDLPDRLVAPQVKADLTLLLSELVENAVVFSPPGSPVTVSGTASRAGVRLEIVDRGMGMSDAELAGHNSRLLQRERLDIAPSPVLGLVVVGRTARRHGGGRRPAGHPRWRDDRGGRDPAGPPRAAAATGRRPAAGPAAGAGTAPPPAAPPRPSPGPHRPARTPRTGGATGRRSRRPGDGRRAGPHGRDRGPRRTGRGRRQRDRRERPRQAGSAPAEEHTAPLARDYAPPGRPARRAARAAPSGCARPPVPPVAPTAQPAPPPGRAGSAPSRAGPGRGAPERTTPLLGPRRRPRRGPRPRRGTAGRGGPSRPGGPDAGPPQHRGEPVTSGPPTTLSADAQEFCWLLDKLAADTPGVRDAIAVSADGLLISASGSEDHPGAQRLAAVVSGMISLAGGAARGAQPRRPAQGHRRSHRRLHRDHRDERRVGAGRRRGQVGEPRHRGLRDDHVLVPGRDGRSRPPRCSSSRTRWPRTAVPDATGRRAARLPRPPLPADGRAGGAGRRPAARGAGGVAGERPAAALREARHRRARGSALSIAEISARLGLHLGVVRVLVSQMHTSGHLDVLVAPVDAHRDVAVLERVIHGLRSLG